MLGSTRMTVARPTRFTPFKVLYGSEAGTPEEIKLSSLRTMEAALLENSEVAQEQCSEEERMDKELLEETRLQVVTKLDKYVAYVQKTYKPKVHSQEFVVVDLVLKRNLYPMSVRKLQSKW